MWYRGMVSSQQHVSEVVNGASQSSIPYVLNYKRKLLVQFIKNQGNCIGIASFTSLEQSQALPHYA